MRTIREHDEILIECSPFELIDIAAEMILAEDEGRESCVVRPDVVIAEGMFGSGFNVEFGTPNTFPQFVNSFETDMEIFESLDEDPPEGH